jgi:hypothetical protein
MAEILSGARKYRIGLTLAHHELHQLQRNPEVASAVMSHPYTRIVFRVGDDDAKKLGEGFDFFEPKDLRNLETGQAIARVERSDFDFNLSVPLPILSDAVAVAARRQEVITGSRKKYGTARADVEAMLATSRASSPTVERPTSPPLRAVTELPKVADVPKATGSENKTVAAGAPKPPAVESPTVKREPPRDLGRGGEQHKAIQKRIKEAAASLGFRCVIEQPVLDGLGCVDLFLERGDQKIACEISISTTIDHEVGNVAKCLKSGVPKVAVICLDEERLRKISSAVSGSLGAEAAACVSYYLPDPFIAHLTTLPRTIPKEFEAIDTRWGYKIKRSAPGLTTEERKQKEDVALLMIAEAMRQKPR